MDRYTYHADGRLDQIIGKHTDVALGNTVPEYVRVSNDYDKAGRLVKEWRGNRGTAYTKRSLTYNDNSHIIDDTTTKTDHYTSQVRYSGEHAGYDGAGNVLGYVMEETVQGTPSYTRVNEYETRYRYFDSYKEAGTLALEKHNTHPDYGINGDMTQPGSSHFVYDHWGNEVVWMDLTEKPQGNVKNRIAFYRNTAQGQMVYKHLVDGFDVNSVAQFRELFNDYNYLLNQQVIGSVTSERKPDGSFEKYHYNFSPVKSTADLKNTPSTDGRYITVKGDSLSSIAQMVYGDAALWYLIADANGLNGSADLQPGMSLKIPSSSGQINNNASTFKPYNPQEIMGDTQVTQASAPPPRHTMSECDQAVIIIVAIIVTLITKGAMGDKAYAAVVAAMAGNAAGQTAAMIMGEQEKFDFGSMARAGVKAWYVQGITGGVLEGLDVAADSAVGGIIQNVVAQGADIAMGDQEQFSWGGVAAAGVIQSEAFDFLKAVDVQGLNVGEIARESLKSVAKGVITRAIQVGVDGRGKIEFAQIAATAFGDALGNAIVAQIDYDNRQQTQKEAERIFNISNYSPIDGNYSPDPNIEQPKARSSMTSYSGPPQQQTTQTLQNVGGINWDESDYQNLFANINFLTKEDIARHKFLNDTENLNSEIDVHIANAQAEEREAKELATAQAVAKKQDLINLKQKLEALKYAKKVMEEKLANLPPLGHLGSDSSQRLGYAKANSHLSDRISDITSKIFCHVRTDRRQSFLIFKANFLKKLMGFTPVSFHFLKNQQKNIFLAKNY